MTTPRAPVHIVRSRRRASRWMALSLAGLALVAGGCADVQRAQQSGDAAMGSRSALAALDALARRQAQTPDRASMSAPTPPGAQPALPADAPQSPLADKSLSDAVASLADRLGEVLGEPPPSTETPDGQRREALRLYVSGRAKLLSGDVREATADLRDAARLDPSAADPWRELGEAALAIGDRFNALAAFRETLRRSPDDLESLTRLGLMLADRGQQEEAAIVLSRARQGLDDRDSALPFLVDRALGEALLALGAARPASEALQNAVALPERSALATRFSRELAQMERDRSVLWRRLGDALLAQDRMREALDAYQTALSLPSFDPVGIRALAVYAALRTGQSATAARLALDGLLGSGGQVDDHALELLQFVAGHSGIQPQIARAVDALIADQPAETRARAAGALALARSAILSGDQAIESLVQRLKSAPADAQALWALRQRLAGESAEKQVAAFVDLTAQWPMRAGQYADALLYSATPAQVFLDALERAAGADGAPARAAALLRAEALSALGRSDDAAKAIEALTARAPDYAPALYEKALILIHRGDVDGSAPLLRALSAVRAPADRLLVVAALEAAHRTDEAQKALDETLADESTPAPVRSDALLLAASLAERRGDAEQAGRRLRQLIALDPSREEGYAGLIALRAPGGADADPRRLAEAVRALRDAIPSSRLLRWLHAQDLAREGRLDQAERELLDLARERVEPNMIALLTNIWMRAGALDRARDWLQERSTALPNMTALRAALARVMAEKGEPAQAADMLFALLDEHPQDQTLLRTLETILRDKLGQEIEADRLALRRLDSQPRTPEALAERSGALLRLGRITEASAPLLEALAWDAPLRPSQGSAVAAQAVALAQSALSSGQPAFHDVAALFDALASKVQPLPIQAHLARLEIGLRDDATDPARIGDALALAMAQHADQAAQLAATILGRGLEAGRSALVAALAPRVNGLLPEPSSTVHALWLQAAAGVPDADAVLAALRAIESGGTGVAIVRQLRNVQPNRETESSAIAELAYQVSGIFYPGDEAAYESLLRFALAHDPDHALANNDLGYQLADRGERLDEAHAMLRRAYRLAPNRSAVIDSLGWVRYKLGLLDDQTTPDGERIEGAITLLRKATQTQEGSSDPVVRDHYGDALWRTGDTDGAVGQWRIARAVAQTRLAQVPQAASVDQQIIEQAQRKLDAVSQGRTPPVAPVRPDSSRIDSPAPAGAGDRKGG